MRLDEVKERLETIEGLLHVLDGDSGPKPRSPMYQNSTDTKRESAIFQISMAAEALRRAENHLKALANPSNTKPRW